MESKKDEPKPQQANHPERDSIGLFYVNPSQLVLNQDPLASIYTGAPGGPPDSASAVQTPLLGAKQGAAAATSTERQAQEKEDKADSILDHSEEASQHPPADQQEDAQMSAE